MSMEKPGIVEDVTDSVTGGPGIDSNFVLPVWAVNRAPFGSSPRIRTTTYAAAVRTGWRRHRRKPGRMSLIRVESP